MGPSLCSTPSARTSSAGEAEEEEAATLGVDGRSEGGAGAAGRRTAESVRGAERVLEALSVLDGEEERAAEYEAALARHAAAPPDEDRPRPTLVPNLLLLGLTPGASP
mmetsp:Transcript_22846/g.67727  ORF Transcript_22846/g.67727 Transcript_22846/m.67727 type:complete len:108 (+) Transcript_22846:337-660(+)